MKSIIAIDGPAGAGKSTIAKSLAEALNYLYIDTGAMYRAVAYQALQQEAPLDNVEQLGQIAAQAQLDMRVENGENRIASTVSAVPQVREQLVPKQRELAERGRAVLDGRDIGTVVLPQADCKIYLTASLDERAERRYKELLGRGLPADLAEVRQDIEQRDYQDTHRETSPLRQAEDAKYLDTTGLSIEQVLQQVLQLAEAAE